MMVPHEIMPASACPPLTPQQAKFVAAMQRPGTRPAEAAMAAGYSARSARTHAYALLRKPAVRVALQGCGQWAVVAPAAPMSREDWLAHLTRLANGGSPAGVQLRALRMLGQAHGWTRRVRGTNEATTDHSAPLALAVARARLAAQQGNVASAQ